MKQKIKKILKVILIALVVIFCLFTVFVIHVGRKADQETEEIYKRSHFSKMAYFDESDKRSYGYGGDGWSIDFEALYGITLKTDGSDVSCTPYCHKENVTLNGISLDHIASDTWEKRKIKDLPASGIGDPYNSDHSVTGYLHVSKSIAKCCRVTDTSQKHIDEQLGKYHEIVDALNPADYLDDSKLCYPTTYYGKTNAYKSSYSCVPDYQTLSDQLVDESWSDAAKVYAFARYMTDNYAYDEYQVEELHNKARAVVADDVDNPALWLYSSHVGMCQDFINAFVIMCRHHNIPCTSIADSRHVVPAVYINSEWVAIDVNPLLPKCILQDINPGKWIQPEQQRWDREYGFIAYGMNEIEPCIDYLP